MEDNDVHLGRRQRVLLPPHGSIRGGQMKVTDTLSREARWSTMISSCKCGPREPASPSGFGMKATG